MSDEKSSQTQCELSDSIEICNVIENVAALPLINGNISGHDLTFLCDTGSSVSILSQTFFDKFKSTLKYKRLGSNITLKTLNSYVDFSSCIKLTFKVKKFFFSHNFYIVNMSDYSKFHGILGMDFIKENHVTFDFADNSMRFGKCNFSYKFNHDIVNCDDLNDNETQSNAKLYVTLAEKVIISPGQSQYISAKVKNIRKNQNYLFISDDKNDKLHIMDSIVATNIIDENQIATVNLFLQNDNSENLHLNKSMFLGELHEIDQIKNYPSREQNENKFIGDSSNILSNSVNLIQASDQIIQKRKNDLSSSDFCLEHLNTVQKKIIEKLLLDKFCVFSKSLSTLGHTDKVVPNLRIINDFPIKTLPFPIPQALQKEAQDQINQLVDADIIERNCSEWACPILLVKKKSDGNKKQRFRLTLDLRMVNTVIQGSSYPLPKIQDIISNLSSYKFFTSLDFNQAYHQVNLPEKYRDMLTFTSIFGSFRYKRLCFGLKNASSIFQSLMDSILDEVNLEGIFAYQDDLIIGSNSFEETCQKITKILDVLIKYNLTLSPEKCQFHKSDVNYLGFHIENHTISPISSNIVKINSLPVPTTKRQVKRILGLANFYKWILPAFSELAQPLVELTKPKTVFKWTDEHQEVFQNIQKLFFLPPMVRLPDWTKTFYVNTDASKIAISGSLMQKFDGKLLPIAYFSKSLIPSQKKYPALKLELMAIHKSVTAFKYYLYNRQFVLLSDSAPLEKYKKTTNPADITTRWLMDLSEYTFKFEHIAGKKNILADYLSRCNFENNQDDLRTNPNLIHDSQPLPIVNLDEEEIQYNDNKTSNITLNQKNEYVNFMITGHSKNKDPLLEISDQTFVNEQINDPELKLIYDEILKNGPSEKFKDYFIHPESKVLMYKKKEILNNAFKYLIVVPNKLKAKTLSIAHLSHFGLTKTYEFLTRKYFWKGIYTDTLNFVASCLKCLQIKHHRTPPAPLRKMYTPTHPNQTVSTDLVGPFSNGQYVLTIIDHFSRHLEVYPLATITSPKIVQCLFSYITTFGRPACILSDLGRQYTSHIYDTFNDSIGIKIRHSSVGHPQSNSLSERINTSLKYSVNTLLLEGHSFKNALLIHKSLYNGSKHSSTQFSPNLLHFGRELSLIFDTYNSQCNNMFLDTNVDIYKLMQDLNIIYQKAYNNILASQDKRNEYFKRKAKLRDICNKDIVYLKSIDKFKPKYTGPFIVICKHSPVSFSIKRLHDNDDRAFRIHIDRLLLAPPRNNHLFDSNVNYETQVNNQYTHTYNLRPRR